MQETERPAVRSARHPLAGGKQRGRTVARQPQV